MKRYNLIFKGRVQAVGFRYKALMLANELNLTGNVHNLYDGDVEVNIQGSKQYINVFIEKLNKDKFIRIDDILIKEIDLIEGEEEFNVI
ncbi:acylphosphatase [Anaerococcus sp. AGMB00486]|uniref:acylphosphatase n=1 Tax=Anaerococcus faecalis TaxID=2742993 RepID=A0ABX2N6W0_9FIRM|nr:MULTISPECIES: acylphosphatase [Anaerococcus]MDY3005985.1 acylphosphatase [Anaerococcus porci]NVF10431.1 acylphosphatase [Anaerococcus faecalis]